MINEQRLARAVKRGVTETDPRTLTAPYREAARAYAVVSQKRPWEEGEPASYPPFEVWCAVVKGALPERARLERPLALAPEYASAWLTPMLEEAAACANPKRPRPDA